MLVLLGVVLVISSLMVSDSGELLSPGEVHMKEDMVSFLFCFRLFYTSVTWLAHLVDDKFPS